MLDRCAPPAMMEEEIPVIKICPSSHAATDSIYSCVLLRDSCDGGNIVIKLPAILGQIDSGSVLLPELQHGYV